MPRETPTCCIDCPQYEYHFDLTEPLPQDLIGRLLERKPGRRLGMLNGRAGDIKRHKWFEGMDWEAMAARRVQAPRIPQDDAAKRMRELAVGVSCVTKQVDAGDAIEFE